MRLLLDTHVFLWVVTGHSALKAPIRHQIQTADEVYVSAVSIWEIAIKARLGKIEADLGILIDELPRAGFLELPVRIQHAARVGSLPPHHSDPFDRLLIAQALVEPLRFLTADRALAQYSEMVQVL